MVDGNGMVYTYTARDGVIVLVRDDQPGIKLFSVTVSDEVFREFIDQLHNNAEEIKIQTWTTSLHVNNLKRENPY